MLFSSILTMSVCEHILIQILNPLLGADDISGNVIVAEFQLCIMDLMVYNLLDDCHVVKNCTF